MGERIAGEAVTGQAGLGFGGLLRRLRDDAGLTQEELAEAARVSQRAISDLERGINRTARKDTAGLLADALGLAGPVRALFVAAARGRTPAAAVLASMQRREQPASWAAAGGVHGFPAALTSFIGREAAACQVADLLAGHRLVTVTGPGGSGKTRLATEVARQVAGRFADGAWLAELAPVSDPAHVPAVVAGMLGVREQPGRPAAETLARALARQQLLLVLDNCEHVAEAAAALCAGLLAACDDVRVLATSREPLRVAGEARCRLGPLALPDLDDLAAASGCEAVALFTDRARSADAHFVLTGEAVPAVAGLVRRLDGMPLAIELAAAQAEALGVRGLLDRFDERFVLLASGDRLAPSRQRSLAATVDWSYRLLDDAQQRVFRAVSVFPAGFTLEAAEAVAGVGAAPVVAHLVDCSLVVAPRAGPDGRLRYSMLETLRDYAAARLAEAGEHDEAAAALAGYALGVAEQAATGLQTRAGEQDAARWLDGEAVTMHQALAWAVAHDIATALRLVAALGWWWYRNDQLGSQYQLLAEITRHAERGSDQWCTVQFWLGWAAFFPGDIPRALEHFTVLSDAIGQEPSRGLIDALQGLSAALRELGRPAEAIQQGRRALAMSRELGYPFGEIFALANLAWAAAVAGDLDEAVRLARQTEQISGDIPGSIVRTCSLFLAMMLIEADEFTPAEPVCVAGLAAARDAGDLFNQRALLHHLALVELRAGRTGDAAAHLREAIQIESRAGTLSYGDLDDCAHLCAAAGRHAEAVTAWAAYTALGRDAGIPDWPGQARRREQPLRQARRVLGPGQARAAEERGVAMSAATACDYALLLTAEEPRPSAAGPELGQLTARERELLTLLAQGGTDAQIAAQLDISIRTVRTHLDRIRDKTGCRRRADLTRLALSAQLV